MPFKGMLSVGATCLVDKSGEEGVSAFVISGEPSPAKPENTGFFPATGGLGISHHPARLHAIGCCRRLVHFPSRQVIPLGLKMLRLVAFSERPSDSIWLENAQVGRIFQAAK
jgi:hypothetical protein